MEMQRFRLLDYKMQLLGELQRQQNSALFCDTLLQSDGISVPAHSCVLAAFSPYLSQKLSTSPTPQSGQQRQLQLQAVKAKTLLKLVSLLYSGELEVEGSIEQNDLLAAARKFGIADLIEGQRDGVKEGEWEEKPPSLKSGSDCGVLVEEGANRDKSRKRDAEVQTEEMAGSADTESPVKTRSCVSKGTQMHTDKGTPTPSAPEVPTDVHSESVSQTLSSKAVLDCSSDTITDPTSTAHLSSDLRTFPTPPRDDSNPPGPQEDSTLQQPSVIENSVQALAGDATSLEHRMPNGVITKNTDHTEQNNTSRDEIQADETGNAKMKSNGSEKFGMKNLIKMKRMMETRQISIKNEMNKANMPCSPFTLVVTDASKLPRQQRRLPNIQPLSSDAHQSPLHKPETQVIQSGPTDSPETPPQCSTTACSQASSSNHCTPTQNSDPQKAPLSQSLGPVEDSDEQIEKLLEDIMMGLNILPAVNLGRDCSKSHHLQQSHNGASAICQDPVTESEAGQSQMHATASAPDCVSLLRLSPPTQAPHLNNPMLCHCPKLKAVYMLKHQQEDMSHPQYATPVSRSYVTQ
ncbi:hypothetical protein LDENG_00216910 [Lucifuga dentata]|nr:hypothetical protein LDENG_00216910 [Lucifuga dentata]